ncbi:ZWICHEL kinesin-like calmodulin-binding protein, partial [Prunus dulcis]
ILGQWLTRSGLDSELYEEVTIKTSTMQNLLACHDPTFTPPPPPPHAATWGGTGSVGTTTLPTFHSTPPPPRSAAVHAGISHERQRFGQIFTKLSTLRSLSFLHQIGHVLRPPIRSRRTLSGSGSVGLLVEFLGKCSIYRGDSAKIFGRKSRFLVSGPGIREMSVTRRDSLRFSRILGRVLSLVVLKLLQYISIAHNPTALIWQNRILC